MTITNRAEVFSRLQKVLTKHYKPINVDGQRPILENLIFAACLENAHYSTAVNAYRRLEESFFDWNEVRVASLAELAELFKALPDPARTAQQVKRTIQSVFEANYQFDLEGLKKQNIGKTVSDLGKYDGVSPFAIAFVTQHALGGHAIPIDDGALQVLHIVGAISDEEFFDRAVPGLERAVAKKSGPDFASIIHEAGADLVASPLNSPVRAVLCEVTPDAKTRLPRRIVAKKPTDPSATEKSASPQNITNSKGGKPSESKTKRDQASTKSPSTKTKSDASRPEIAKPDLAKSDASRSQAAKSDAAKPELRRSEESTKLELTKPDIAKSDTAKHDKAKHDSTKTDAAKPDAAKTSPKSKLPEPKKTPLKKPTAKKSLAKSPGKSPVKKKPPKTTPHKKTSPDKPRVTKKKSPAAQIAKRKPR